MSRSPERSEGEESAFPSPLCGRGIKGEGDGTVLILGAGPIGLLHLMLHKAAGRKVIVAGRNEARLQVARLLGADVAFAGSLEDLPWSVMEATDGLGAELIIEAAGSRELWEAAPSLVRKGGKVLLFGGCPPDTKVSFDAGRIHYDEISLIGAFHFTPGDVAEAHRLLAEGVLDVKPLISGEYPLTRLVDAFEELIAGRGIKYAIIP